MGDEACCTCATLLSSIPPQYDEKTEKPAKHERRLDCCGRAICARCTSDNPRFQTYCPFCQISTAPSSIPAQGLRQPPAYSPPPDVVDPVAEGQPPPYSASTLEENISEKSTSSSEDVLHFVDHAKDSIHSLSLRYGVPVAALRKTNNLFTDSLLAARRTILIPGEYYKGGVSLSPRPIEGEEEELRKGKIRRWMVACKSADYDIAQLYLKQSDFNLEDAIQAYQEDERWEKEHPLQASKGKDKARDGPGRRRFKLGGDLTGQAA